MRPNRKPQAAPSDALRAVITARGLPSHAVAAAAGLAPSIVSRWMAGQRGLTLDSFDRIAAALGLRLVETGRRPGTSQRTRRPSGTGEEQGAAVVQGQPRNSQDGRPG